MACPAFAIVQNGLTLTFTARHAEKLSQKFTPIGNGGQFRARATNGDLITQSLWIKYKAAISGSGELPNGLLRIDFFEDFDIYSTVSNFTGGELSRHGSTFSWSESSGVFVPGGGQESSNYIRLTCHAITHSVGAEAGGVSSFSLEAEEI